MADQGDKDRFAEAPATQTLAPRNPGVGSDFEADLFRAVGKLRGNMEPSDYKRVALGLIFLKHISDSFEARYAVLLAEYPEGTEDPDEYAVENVFWVPKEARWSRLKANARQPTIEYDSEIERQFAQDLDTNDFVRLFVKLPSWFKIDTPIRPYNPDWAFVTDRNEKLHFVHETKGSLDSEDRRNKENQKIACDKKHFETIGVDYDVVTSLSGVAL